MPEGKLVPELRFPEFSGEWEEKELGEMAYDYSYGMNSSAMKYDGINKYVRITDIDSITNNYLENNLVSPSDILEDKYLLSEGDILFARTGASVGKTYYYKKGDGKVYFAGYLIRFRIRSEYSYKFIFYNTLTNQYENWVKVMSVRSGQPGINSKEYSKLKILMPNKKEQEKIGVFFHEIDRKLELQKEKIEELENYKKAMMQRIFDQEIRFKDENGEKYPEWGEIKLGLIAKIKTGNSNVQDSEEDGIYNFFDRSIVVKKLNKYDYDEEAIIYPGEGSKFYPKYYKGKYALHQRAYSITSNKINMKYLSYMLMLRNNHFLRMAVGSTVKSLRMDNFAKCPIYLPVEKEQEKIANFLSSIDNKIELEKEKLEKYEELKRGLMQRMFI